MHLQSLIDQLQESGKVSEEEFRQISAANFSIYSSLLKTKEEFETQLLSERMDAERNAVIHYAVSDPTTLMFAPSRVETMNRAFMIDLIETHIQASRVGDIGTTWLAEVCNYYVEFHLGSQESTAFVSDTRSAIKEILAVQRIYAQDILETFFAVLSRSIGRPTTFIFENDRFFCEECVDTHPMSIIYFDSESKDYFAKRAVERAKALDMRLLLDSSDFRSATGECSSEDGQQADTNSISQDIASDSNKRKREDDDQDPEVTERTPENRDPWQAPLPQ